MARWPAHREPYGLQFRVEAFDLFNNGEFSNPDVNLTDQTFGQITNTIANSERTLQLALRVTF